MPGHSPFPILCLPTPHLGIRGKRGYGSAAVKLLVAAWIRSATGRKDSQCDKPSRYVRAVHALLLPVVRFRSSFILPLLRMRRPSWSSNVGKMVVGRPSSCCHIEEGTGSVPLTPTLARECIYNQCDVGVKIMFRTYQCCVPRDTQHFHLFPLQAAVPAMAN